MSLTKQKATLKKLGLIGGILEIIFKGFSYAFSSDAMRPSSSGIQFVIDILFLSFSNPYALLGGVLVYLFFYRYADKLEKTRKGEYDLGYILIGISVLIGEIIFVITMWNAISHA